jgi:transcriptional regulator with XRE-family HTH domain
MTKRNTETDVVVGARIRARRVSLGLSQQQLAAKVGVTYQQLHKYEHGINRVSASRLQDIAQALGITVGSLFENVGCPVLPPTEGRRLALETSRLMQEMPEWARQSVAALAKTLHFQTVGG